MHFLGEKNAKNALYLGLHPASCWGSLHQCSEPLAGFKGPTSKGREGEDREER